MLRRTLGFLAFAIVAWLLLKVVFAVLGGLIGLAFTVLWLAATGFLCYVVLRVFFPDAAARIHHLIKGRPA